MDSFPIFEKLNGEAAALDVIERATGKRPNDFTVRKWRQLGRIPGNKAVHLIDACVRSGANADYQNDCVLASGDRL